MLVGSHTDPFKVIDTENTTLLHLAASNRKLVAARMLLRKGADPNTPDKKGWTAFHCAAKAKEFTLCDMLLEKGGDPSLPNSSHSSPTHYLARCAVYVPSLGLVRPRPDTFQRPHRSEDTEEVHGNLWRLERSQWQRRGSPPRRLPRGAWLHHRLAHRPWRRREPPHIVRLRPLFYSYVALRKLTAPGWERAASTTLSALATLKQSKSCSRTACQ